MEKGEMGENATGRLTTYYVAECMEFNRYGEYREDIHSAEEAVKIYQSIPSERLNAGKGIGLHVEDWIIEKFAGLDRAQGEELGLAISLEMAKAALPYADGLYLMTPFNRVALMERLIGRLKQEVLGAY